MVVCEPRLGKNVEVALSLSDQARRTDTIHNYPHTFGSKFEPTTASI
jgi:hypothetical protein